jgi:dTDP-D-glucose 4,6-dehydratase
VRAALRDVGAARRALELHGGGGAARDWLYVEDCVDGVLACLECRSTASAVR